ncbi:hypothetical protein D4R99_01250 [bacterium]|nr:MAG: hypothetical protein D4R99_01250 [bacterium]
MKKYTILIIALVLGAFLRLWQLSNVPNGLTWDEAGIGYNAYSILKTGRDEHGAFFPLIFKSFGDYKPGAYIYLTVPSIAIFGLNEFAVRFPSALAGILAILGVYLLSNILFPNEKVKIRNWELKIGHFSAFALAISPWHVHFSHGAWEVNVFSTLVVFALYYFLTFIKGKSSIYPTLFFVCFSLVMYQAAKLFIPLVFLLLVVLFWSDFWINFIPYLKSKKIFLVLPFFLFSLWILFGSIFGSAGNRLTTLSIFNYKPNITPSLFHNQVELSTSLVLSRYLYHFSPEVLFYEGSVFSERGHIPSLGVLHPLEIVWLVFGIVWLAKLFPDKKTLLVVGLLLIAPIPASLTLAEFSTYRALFMVVPLAIISGVGMYYCFGKFKLFLLPFLLLYFLISVYVFDVYFLHSQNVFAKEFNYGYKQAVQIIKDNPTKKVIFTDVLGQPYIYYVFYTAYDPATYQKNIDFISGGLDVGRVGRVGNVEFHQFSTDDIKTSKDTLFVGSIGNINDQVNFSIPNIVLYQQINTPDNFNVIFRVVKTKP